MLGFKKLPKPVAEQERDRRDTGDPGYLAEAVVYTGVGVKPVKVHYPRQLNTEGVQPRRHVHPEVLDSVLSRRSAYCVLGKPNYWARGEVVNASCTPARLH